MAGDKLSSAELEHSDSEKVDLQDSPKDVFAGASTSSAERLSPTPTDDPDDPLNWPMGIKVRYNSEIFSCQPVNIICRSSF